MNLAQLRLLCELNNLTFTEKRFIVYHMNHWNFKYPRKKAEKAHHALIFLNSFLQYGETNE